MTLHEAIKKVLLANNNRGLTANEVADWIRRKDLYRRHDKKFPEPKQIHARVRNYPHMFRKRKQPNGNQLIFLK